MTALLCYTELREQMEHLESDARLSRFSVNILSNSLKLSSLVIFWARKKYHTKNMVKISPEINWWSFFEAFEGKEHYERQF